LHNDTTTNLNGPPASNRRTTDVPRLVSSRSPRWFDSPTNAGTLPTARPQLRSRPRVKFPSTANSDMFLDCHDRRPERSPIDASEKRTTPVELELASNRTTHHIAPQPRRRHCRQATISPAVSLCALLICSAPLAAAQNCISLADSTACPAFSAASISTDSNLSGLFPFLSSVSDTASFDSGLTSYIAGDFTELRYACCGTNTMLNQRHKH
jgi:hypothetical protein